MFGVSFLVSNISPILRRAGNKVVYSDQGFGEPGVIGDDGFLFPAEVSELKFGSIPMHAAAIMPSPILLRRFKVLLFIVWGISCCKIGWDSVMRMSADLRDLFIYEAFLYYNPLLLVTMLVWLWGVNLWVFSHSSVNYSRVFDLDHNHLTHGEMWKCATWMTIIVPTSMTAYLYLYSHGEVSLSASQPVFSDLERSVCRMVNRQVATIAWFEADAICGSHSVAIPLVLVFPYLCRFFQCLRQYKDTKEKTCLLNALKYSTAVPVIFLSALKYHVFPDKWTNFYHPLWLLSSAINSLYSFYWDISRDWDLSILSQIFNFKSSNLCSSIFHGRIWVYYWAIGSNLILRCTWTYKLSAHLRHNYLTVFTIAALEILRRFQWVFFRVENEWNKMTAKPNLELSMDEIPEEEDKTPRCC